MPIGHTRSTTGTYLHPSTAAPCTFVCNPHPSVPAGAWVWSSFSPSPLLHHISATPHRLPGMAPSPSTPHAVLHPEIKVGSSRGGRWGAWRSWLLLQQKQWGEAAARWDSGVGVAHINLSWAACGSQAASWTALVWNKKLESPPSSW